MKLKIEGSKINLRKLTKSDAKDIYLNARDKEIARYTTLPHPYKLEHALDFIKKTYRDIRKKAAYELGIELKETGRIIGMMSLLKIDYINKMQRLVTGWVKNIGGVELRKKR
jgi:ribosomal-protein-alanine N-acetyltransferase